MATNDLSRLGYAVTRTDTLHTSNPKAILFPNGLVMHDPKKDASVLAHVDGVVGGWFFVSSKETDHSGAVHTVEATFEFKSLTTVPSATGE